MDWLQTLLDNSTTPLLTAFFIRPAYSSFTLSIGYKYSCYRFYRKRY